MTEALSPTLVLSDLFAEDSNENPICFPLKIEPILPYAIHSQSLMEYVYRMEKILRKMLFSKLSSLSKTAFIEALPASLPCITWNHPSQAPDCFEICCLCFASKEEQLETIIANMIQSWLLPGKTPSILSTQSLNFQWEYFPDKTFFLCQVQLLLENEKDIESAQEIMPSLALQIESGMKNKSYIQLLFQQRPLLEDMKSSQIHRSLINLTQKHPNLFDESIFVEMGRFFALISKAFLSPRSHRLITKIVTAHYLMRIHISRLLSIHPEQKHIQVRYARTHLNFCFGSKPALGLILAISSLDKHEFFQEEHILQAAQALLPNVQSVKGSFFIYQGVQDPIRTLYLELEKKDGSRFTQSDLSLLKQELEEELKRRVERLVPTIFMARNEEETMRNILILSQELKYISDLPQVMISLDKQTASEIFFTLILVRLQRPGQPSLLKSFESLKTDVQFFPDRIQQVGFLRKNYPKEANVFHLRLPKHADLLRADYSVNFYLAREKISSLLIQAIGPFRDYNGGMILKQGELFYQFKDSFHSIAQKNPELLENFFFSLNPIESQATLPLGALQNLFHLFLEAHKSDLNKKEHYFLKIEEKKDQLFTIIRTLDASFKEDLNATLIHHELWAKTLIHTSLPLQGSLYTGFIFPTSDSKKQYAFIEAIHEALNNWNHRIRNEQILRLSFFDIPGSFDPRLGGDEFSCTILKMLFEGLTRLDKNGKPDLAIAQSIDISKDLKKYLFKLRKCYWSNGMQVTAFDFEYAWKQILSPHFSTPFAYFFYPIKNAKTAKENKCSLDQVGIHALDPLTLTVELEHPTPEFLELTAHTLFSPVYHAIDQIHPDWAARGSEDFVCNGPFMLHKIMHHTRFEFSKNPFYWDKDSVRIQKIHLTKDNSLIANEMFKNDEIDWLGKPMRPWEPFFEENKEEQISSSPMGIYWCVFHMEKFPFHNKTLRRAFDLAIDRAALASELGYEDYPASTPLPLAHTMHHDPEAARGNRLKALELFEQALEELQITRKSFPLITLIYANSSRRERIALLLAEKWRSLFNIPLRAEGFDFNIFFNKMMQGDFQMGAIYWKSWIDHPLYTLNAFKSPHYEVNFARWSNAPYQKLLDAAQKELDPVQRVHLLSSAEKILLEDKPVLPIFYEKERNIKKKHLQNVFYYRTTGYLDFKHAYIEK